MSEKNPRRKKVAPAARPKAKICRRCWRKLQRATSKCSYRCYCVEKQERRVVIGRRRKKRAQARSERRTTKQELR